MPVRSKRLAMGTMPPGGVDIYTCPPEETALVKWISLHNRGPVATAMQLGIDPVGLLPTHVVHVANIPAGATQQLDVWWVLQPGDILQGQAALGFIDYVVHGAELEGVAD